VKWDTKVEKLNESGLSMVLPILWPIETYEAHCAEGMRFHKMPALTLKDYTEMNYKGNWIRGVAVEPEHGKVVGCLKLKEGQWTKSTHTTHLMNNLTEGHQGQSSDVYKAANKRVGINVAAFSVLGLDGSVTAGKGEAQLKRKKCKSLAEDSDDSQGNYLDDSRCVGVASIRTQVGNKEERGEAGLPAVKESGAGGGKSAFGAGRKLIGVGGIVALPGQGDSDQAKSLKTLRAGNGQRLICKDVLCKLTLEFEVVGDDRYVGRLKVSTVTKHSGVLDTCLSPKAIKALRDADGDGSVFWAVPLISEMQCYQLATQWVNRLIGFSAEGDINIWAGSAEGLKSVIQEHAALTADAKRLVTPAIGYSELVVLRAAKLVLAKCASASDNGDQFAAKAIASLLQVGPCVVTDFCAGEKTGLGMDAGLENVVPEIPLFGAAALGSAGLVQASAIEGLTVENVDTNETAEVDGIQCNTEIGCSWLAKQTTNDDNFRERHIGLIYSQWEAMLEQFSKAGAPTKGSKSFSKAAVATLVDKSLTMAPKDIPIHEGIKKFVDIAAINCFGSPDVDALECFRVIRELCKDREHIVNDEELNVIEDARRAVKSIDKDIFMAMNSYPVAGQILKRVDILISAFGKEHPPPMGAPIPTLTSPPAFIPPVENTCPRPYMRGGLGLYV
jgi:hypothetical protein